jgi:hypothetical protein
MTVAAPDLKYDSDVELRNHCFKVLVNNVGLLGMERFVAYLSREKHDYTKWRQDQFDDMSIEDLGLATRKEGENIRQTRKFFSTSNVEQKVI